ncbi:hypothetical protein BFF94_034655 [Burkholderia catarinensis]|nr:hypothetical protein BFF94_034655 [Burkholderia catarinensis]
MVLGPFRELPFTTSSEPSSMTAEPDKSVFPYRGRPVVLCRPRIASSNDQRMAARRCSPDFRKISVRRSGLIGAFV